MATIRDLFKKQNKDIYGLSGKAIIESKGLINPPRGAALLTSSPDALADLIGNQIGGILKGSANRPSDTIFKNKTPFAKPITLGKTQRGIKDAIQPDTDYYIKQTPAPASIFAKLKQGATSPLGLLGNAAVGAINKFGSKKGKKDIENYVKGLKDSIDKKDSLGAKNTLDVNGKVLKNDRKASDFEPIFEEIKNKRTESPEWGVSGYTERDSLDWDSAGRYIRNGVYFTGEGKTQEQLLEDSAYTYMKIKILGSENPIYFDGTISGINESFSPEWNTYKYIGSPFKVHTYTGVERSLSFDFKLFFTNNNERKTMLKKLNYLTSLVYPYRELSQITYENSPAAQQTMFAPNFIFLSIKSFYNNIFGFVDTLSFTIDDNVNWVNFGPEDKDNNRLNKYSTPSVINVQFGMKIIDSKNTLGYNDSNLFKYNFRNQDEVFSKTARVIVGELESSTFENDKK